MVSSRRFITLCFVLVLFTLLCFILLRPNSISTVPTATITITTTTAPPASSDAQIEQSEPRRREGENDAKNKNSNNNRVKSQDEEEKEEEEEEDIDEEEDTNSSSVSSNSSSSSSSFSVSLSEQKTFRAQQREKRLQCARKLSLGYFWNYSSSTSSSSSCELIPGFLTPLQPFEVSYSELSCSSNKASVGVEDEQTRNSEQEGMRKKIDSPAMSAYENFKRQSSWLFRQVKSWAPHPVFNNHSNSGSDNNSSGERFEYHGYHDKENKDVENLYRIDNFCLSPTRGLSGYFSSLDAMRDRVAPYVGLDDTRDRHHGEREFKLFFSYSFSYSSLLSSSSSSSTALTQNYVTRLKSPPDFFDARRVVFMPSMLKSRMNIGHVGNKFLALIGILNIVRKVEESSLKPLIVFVHQQQQQQQQQQNADRNITATTTTTSAFGFFFAALDLPWAVVFADRFERQQQENNRNNNNKNTSSTLCFQRGFVYQNCFNCDPTSPPEFETESYSFGNFVPMTETRRALIDQYKVLLRRCLPFISSSVLQQENQNQNQKPRLFIHVRSGHRGIRNFGLMIGLINRALKDDVSEIVYREPWKSSRAEQLQKLRQSDIFFGPHSGVFAEVVHLRKNPVVVEVAPYWASSASCGDRPGCWFAPFTSYANASHWVVVLGSLAEDQHNHAVVSRGGGAAAKLLYRDLTVKADTVIFVLREAICRWWYKRGGNRRSDEHQNSVNSDNGNVFSPRYCQLSKFSRKEFLIFREKKKVVRKFNHHHAAVAVGDRTGNNNNNNDDDDFQSSSFSTSRRVRVRVPAALVAPPASLFIGASGNDAPTKAPTVFISGGSSFHSKSAKGSSSRSRNRNNRRDAGGKVVVSSETNNDKNSNNDQLGVLYGADAKRFHRGGGGGGGGLLVVLLVCAACAVLIVGIIQIAHTRGVKAERNRHNEEEEDSDEE